MYLIDNSRKSILFWAAVGLVFFTVILVMFFYFHEAYVWLGTEDDLGENMTSVFYLAAGILLIYSSLNSLRLKTTQWAREILPVLLGLFFIFIAGEEISWGQRMFGFGTPESIRSHNLQGETTLHNLSIFHLDSSLLNQHSALNGFALLFGVLIPLGSRYSRPFREFLDRLNFPTSQLSVMVWFVIGLIHGQTIAKMYPHWSNPEVKELIFSVGIFLFSVGYFQKRRQSPQEST